jgi:hypothetical protein
LAEVARENFPLVLNTNLHSIFNFYYINAFSSKVQDRLRARDMAEHKRRLNGADSATTKRAKIHTLNQDQKSINRIKPSSVKKSVLPSPDDSSISEDDSVISSHNQNPAEYVEETKSLPQSKNKTSESNKRPKKPLASVQGVGGVLNGSCS